MPFWRTRQHPSPAGTKSCPLCRRTRRIFPWKRRRSVTAPGKNIFNLDEDTYTIQLTKIPGIDCRGVYEWRCDIGKTSLVFYVGSTCNTVGDGRVYKRLEKQRRAAPGESAGEFIKAVALSASQKKATFFVRFIPTRTSEEAGGLERKLLKTYNYTHNKAE